MKSFIVTVGSALFLTAGLACAGKEPTVNDKDIQVTHFEEMQYPPLARQMNAQGAVVIRAKLDEKGAVVSATAVSGHEWLMAACLSNIKKWQFHPNAARAVVLVYEFRFLEGVCVSGVNGQFVLFAPNIVTVTACRPIVNA